MHKQRVTVDGHNVMTYSFGEGQNVLLLISGGPGLPSNFNQFRDSHAVFAKHGFRVVTWDQLGCGESDMPNDETLWTLERFVKEVEAVRKGLNLGKMHVLGHSWGGVVGLEYCFAYPQWVKSFILACCATSIPEIQQTCDSLKEELGPEAIKLLAKHEATNTTNHPDYQKIVQEFSNKRTCRLPQWPQAKGPSAENVNPRIRELISGLQFLKWTGPLKDWNRLPDLHKLTMPILIIQGEFDWVTPAISQRAHERLTNGEFKLLKNCSHLPFYEDPKAYIEAVSDFLFKY